MNACPTTPTIVLVDDDEGHAILVRECLSDAGIESRLQYYHDGQDFLDHFMYEKPEEGSNRAAAYVIILDIRMPKVDGIEVLRRIKKDVELRKVPVVMLTTSDESHDVELCYSLGCSAYIQKPVDYDHFAEAIRHLAEFVRLLILPAIHRA